MSIRRVREEGVWGLKWLCDWAGRGWGAEPAHQRMNDMLINMLNPLLCTSGRSF